MATPAKPRARKPPKDAGKRKSARPARLAHGRWLGDFPDLSPAELDLVECCRKGEVWKPVGWDGKRPTEKTDANAIRAGLIRFLALGGDSKHPVHEVGVMIAGAWITDALNLHQCHTAVRIDLKHCRFEAVPLFDGAQLPELGLAGSMLPGLHADCIAVTGGIFLRHGFSATGEVRLIGAKIGGSLDCEDGTFCSYRAIALNGDRIRVAGSISLRSGFSAEGEVRFLGAEIGCDLDCSDGSFQNAGGYALSADAIRVAAGIILRDALVSGAISLTSAQIGELIDGRECWKTVGHSLDGLQYGRIIGPTDAASRIAWLKSQRPDQLNADNWAPQPWEQLIKVLREMGHGYEAGEIAIAKQDHMRAVGIIKGPLRRGFHWLYGLLAGYGHRPVRTVGAMITMWLAAAFFFQIGGSFGYMGPSTPLLNNADLTPEVAKQCGHRFETGKMVWTRCADMPPEYTTFQPLLYSLDLILPLVDLQQETDWAPIVEDPPGTDLPYGVFLRWLMWSEILFGWAMSLMLVAVLGRLVEKD